MDNAAWEALGEHGRKPILALLQEIGDFQNISESQCASYDREAGVVAARAAALAKLNALPSAAK